MGVDRELRGKYAALAAEAARDLDRAEPAEILRWALDTFGDEFCISSSMSDAVLIDMASRIRAGVRVIFLDTDYHFAETTETCEQVRQRYPIDLQVVKPMQSIAQQDSLFGPRLHDRDPDACCNLRKVEPLRRALAPYAAWASGIRRDETRSRRQIGVVEWDANRAMVKINPLAAWTEQQVSAYVAEHDVICNPLLEQGYPSIGCAPCTRKVADGEDPRSGRWAGTGKSECGLHVDTDATPTAMSGGQFIQLDRPDT